MAVEECSRELTNLSVPEGDMKIASRINHIAASGRRFYKAI